MKYKTFWRRYCAGVIDNLVFLPLSWADSFLSDPQRELWVLVTWAIFFYSIGWVYSVLFHAKYGQTIGKMVANVRVLDVSEERLPTLKQALIRDSGYIILNTVTLGWFIHLVMTYQYTDFSSLIEGPGILLFQASLGWFLLEILTMTTNEKRRAFHDLIARTTVVRV